MVLSIMRAFVRVVDVRTWLGAAYWALVVLRLCSAFGGYGYVHPDEWMQSGEAYFSLRSDSLASTLPWEWRPDSALRSPAALRAQLLPIALLSNLLGRGAHAGWPRFVLQRAAMVVWTMVVDVAVAATLPRRTARTLLVLYAVSTAATTFAVRPFSNAAEATLVALSLMHSIAPRSGTGWRTGVLPVLPVLPVLTVAGVFTRFTYVAFAAPLVVVYIYRHVVLAWSGQVRAVVLAGVVAAVSAAATAAVYLSIDTRFYTHLGTEQARGVASSTRWRLVVAPLNALVYNAQTANVAEHGLHPRWLHLCVNLPMVIGLANCIALLLTTIHLVRCFVRPRSDREEDRGWRAVVVSLSMVVVGVGVLSVSPHQEPRFLLPIALPSTLVFTYTLSGRYLWSRPTLRRWLVATHVAQHLVQMILFSFLHQAALLPVMFHIDATPNATHLVYRTFSVPTHLAPTANMRAFDSSTSPSTLVELAKQSCTDTAIYTPAWFVADLTTAALQLGISLHPHRSFNWHVDLDHLDSALALLDHSSARDVFAIHKLLVAC